MSTRSIEAIKSAEDRAKQVGLAPAALHKAAGVHRATWNRWRAGKGSPSLDQLDAVEELLGQHGAQKAA